MRFPLLASASLLLIAAAACSTEATRSNGVTGAGGGSGGAAGAGGGSGGAETGPIRITGTDGDFNGSFLITPCMSAGSGFDCPNRLQGQTSCSTDAWMAPAPVGATSEATGTTYSQAYTVAGDDPAATYAVTVHVRGQVEPRTYTGGMRHATTNADPNGTMNDLLYIGGAPGTSRVDYNVFMLTVQPPEGGTAIMDPGTGMPAPQFFAFNSVDTGHEGNHFNFQVDETFTILVRTGFTVTLTNHDSNCIAIKNCGVGGPYGFASADLCEAQARAITGITLPTTYRGAALANGGSQPFQTQFLSFTVTGVVAQQAAP